MLPKVFDRKRAEETARRLREGYTPKPLIERETMKLPGDIVIFPDRAEVV